MKRSERVRVRLLCLRRGLKSFGTVIKINPVVWFMMLHEEVLVEEEEEEVHELLVFFHSRSVLI